MTTDSSNTTSPFQMNSVQTAKQYITELHKDHDQWRAAEQSATEKLVGVLVKCLHLYELMSGDGEEATQLRSDFAEYVKSTKLRFNGETHTVAKIAGVVFNRKNEDYNRRHASHYGRALLKAQRSGVTHDKLAASVEKNGGVTKLAQNPTKVGPTVSDKADEVWASLRDNKLAVVDADEFRIMVDAANVGQRVLLLATQQAKGTFEILGLVQKTSVVDAAFATKHGELNSGDKDASPTEDDPDDLRQEMAAEASA